TVITDTKVGWGSNYIIWRLKSDSSEKCDHRGCGNGVSFIFHNKANGKYVGYCTDHRVDGSIDKSHLCKYNSCMTQVSEKKYCQEHNEYNGSNKLKKYFTELKSTSNCMCDYDKCENIGAFVNYVEGERVSCYCKNHKYIEGGLRHKGKMCTFEDCFTAVKGPGRRCSKHQK